MKAITDMTLSELRTLRNAIDDRLTALEPAPPKRGILHGDPFVELK